MNAEQKLTLALAQMARYSKTGWDQLLAEYRAYSADIDQQLISSPIELLPVAQGRARHAREFLSILEKCLANADQMAKRNN